MTGPRKRSVQFTLLIVGEGDAEVAFLQHLRSIYSAEIGSSITLKNAYGGGGHQALKQAIRDVRAWQYNKAVVMIDTDAHWNDADRKEATRTGIKVVESTPCLEATLLKIAGYRPKENTPDLKDQFVHIFGCEAHEPRYLQAHFGRAVVDAARDNVPSLHDLMNHMGIAKQKFSAG
jgi:hypothetical protein